VQRRTVRLERLTFVVAQFTLQQAAPGSSDAQTVLLLDLVAQKLQGELRDYEREALESYRSALHISPAVAEALHRLYPALVAAMAEKNWDYSRPRWLHRQFQI
jgi:hypothetical protein